MVHRVQSYIHLFDLGAHRSGCGFESIFRTHPCFDPLDAFTDPFDGAGDEANHLVIV